MNKPNRNLETTLAVRILGTEPLKQKFLQSLFWLLKITYNFKKLRTLLMDFCNLILVCIGAVLKKRRNNHGGFFSTAEALGI